MKNKRFISLITILAICMSLFANITISAADETVHEFTLANITGLTDSTNIGPKYPDDNGEYIAVGNLAYSGTSSDAQGLVLGCTGKNTTLENVKSNGSYVTVTAPAKGTVTFTISDGYYYIDGERQNAYGSLTKQNCDLKAGQELVISPRSNGAVLSYLAFTPEPVPTVTGELPEYQSPGTTWDFDDYVPADEGKNAPVASGAVVYNDGDIKFKSDAKATGTLAIDFDEPIQNNVRFSFDLTEHKGSDGKNTLNGRYIEYKILNSEDEEIVFFSAHPYDANSDNSNLIKIGGTAIDKTKSEILTAFNQRGTGITTSVDYHARKVKITMGSSTFEGAIPASAMKDIAKLEFSVSVTNSVSADRYITLDNLAVNEFTSTEQAASAGEITNGYDEKTYGGVTSRVKAPSDSIDKPLVLFLSSKSRFGTDNEGQLYQAQYFFDQLADNAILAAPQTASAWDEDALKAYIAGAKAEYNPTEVVVIGYDEGATAAYSLSDVADKIIPISGGGNVYGKVKAKYWAFGGFLDDTVSIADIRKPVNALQTAGAKVRYTEYPTDKHNILEKVSKETGVIDWIKGDVTDKKVVDLVLFAGQSNMAGRGDYTLAIECPPGAGFEFHSITNPKLLSGEVPYALSTVSEPFGKNDNNSAINDDSHEVDRRAGDMVSSVMKAYYDKTGVPIVGVQASRGGEATDYFLNEARKEEMVARYSAAVKYLEESGYTVRKKFMVWCQGESDGESANRAIEDRYKKNTREIFDTVKTAGITDIFMVKIGHYGGGEEVDARYKNINQWQQELADANDDVYAVADLYQDKYQAQMRDNYHYYQPVYNDIGETVGNAVAEIYKDEVVPAEPEEKEVIMPDEPAVEKDKYEITSSDAEINVASLINYGADTYRVYKADKSYEDVKAVKNKLTNPTNGEVTVVPVYRFNYTTAAKEGYVSSTNAYDSGTGYGVVGAACDANGARPNDGTPLRIDLPNGRYDMNVLRQGGVRTDVYNNGVQFITNAGINSSPQNRQSASGLIYAPQIPNNENSMNITISGTSGNKERIAALEIVRVPEAYQKKVIYIAGDSESATYYPNSADDLDSDQIMMTGFGMMLGKVMSDEYKIYNWGQPGSTAESWSGCLGAVSDSMQSGDVILIDFGINDGNKNVGVNNMKTTIESIITAAKAKKAVPILISPVYNGKYQHKTYFTYDAANDTNVIADFADSMGVDYIDLNKWTQLYANKAIEETGDANWIANNYHIADNLHLTQHGALLAASFIAADMKDLGYETTDFAYTYTDISSVDMTEVEGNHGHKRGTETENKRIYSVAAAEKFMSDGTIMKPEITVDGTTVTVTANPEAGDKPVLIHVTRSGGVLETVETHNLTFENNTASVENLSLNNGDELYAWSSLTGMKPLVGKKTVDNESVQ